jgi:hypothetical protein
VPAGLTVSIAGLQDVAHRLATSAARATRGNANRFESNSNPKSGAAKNVATDSGSQRVADLLDLADKPSNLVYTPSYAEDQLSMRKAVHTYRSAMDTVPA